MYLPDNTTFGCFGYGCYNLGDIYFQNDENNAKWFINGCDSCDSRTECVYDLVINCDRYNEPYYNYSTTWNYHGYTSSHNCSSEASNDCDCYTMFNERTIFDNAVSCSIEIPPTAAPTAAPSADPTAEPTSSPSSDPANSPTARQTIDPTSEIPSPPSEDLADEAYSIPEFSVLIIPFLAIMLHSL